MITTYLFYKNIEENIEEIPKREFQILKSQNKKKRNE